MKYFLKHIAEITLPIGVILSVACIGLWIPDMLVEESTWPIYLTLAIAAFNTFLIMSLMYQTGVTRNRSGLPLVLYALAIGTQTALHTDWKGQLCTTAFLTILFILSRTYRQEHCVEEAFQTSLVACLCIFLVPDMAWIVVGIWIAFGLQRAFSLRVWLSSLVAISLVVIYTWLCNYMHWIDCTISWSSIVARHVMPLNEMKDWVGIGLLVVSGLYFTGLSLSCITTESSSVQSIISLLILFLLISGGSTLFPSQATLAPLFVATVAGIATQAITSKPSILRGISLLVFVLISIAVWILPRVV